MGPVGPVVRGKQQNASLTVRVQPDRAADSVKRRELVAKHRRNVDAAGSIIASTAGIGFR